MRFDETTRDVLCIGIDVTWWGGGKTRATQHETIAFCDLQAPDNLHLNNVDLNPHGRSAVASPTEPNFDPEGAVLLSKLDEIIQQHARPRTKCIIALDSPLEAAQRKDQPPRLKAVAKGVRTGSKRRQCEDELWSFASAFPTEASAGWLRDLRIQSGSPIPIRISRILRGLASREFGLFGAQDNPTRMVIEVFPSEAIWALGVMGHYGDLSSQVVRAYKKRVPTNLELDEARAIASTPLRGFRTILNKTFAARVDGWAGAIAQSACERSFDAKTDRVKKGKAFDDPIDSGLALLTCIAFATGVGHHWGDGSDGVIVGPGVGFARATLF